MHTVDVTWRSLVVGRRCVAVVVTMLGAVACTTAPSGDAPREEPGPDAAVDASLARAVDAGSDSAVDAGSDSAADAAPAPSVPADRLGFSGGAPMLWETDQELEKELTAMEQAGARWVRVGVEWSHVEATKGNYDFSVPDRVIDAAIAHHLQPLGIVLYTPKWAWVPGANPQNADKNRPANPDDFGKFAGIAADHYRERIRHWEIWNEPNLDRFFAPKPDVAQYVALLSAAYSAIHGALAPGEVTVISAGLSPAGNPADGSEIGPVEFLEQLYEHGGGAHLDAVGMHPYCFPALPSDESTASWNAFIRLGLMRDVMVKHGDGAKKIWLTEYGAPTGTADGSVSEALQSSIIVGGLEEMAKDDGLGPLFLYTIRDHGTDLTDREQNFGLLKFDGTPKPSYGAVKNWVVSNGGVLPAP